MQLKNLRFLKGGYCIQANYFTGRRSIGFRKFFATFAHFEHPVHGESVIDAGYSFRFIKATNRFPHILYRMLTPLGFQRLDDETLFRSQRVNFENVRKVFVSHFHGDHIGGLGYFKDSDFVYRSESFAGLATMIR